MIGWLLAIPTLLLVILICIHAPRKHVQSKDYSRTNIIAYAYDDAVRQLSDLKFIRVSEGDDFRRDLSRIKILDDGSSDPGQVEALRGALYDLAMAFHTGTYDAYRKYRTPVEATYNKKVLDYHKTILEKFYKAPGETLPDEAESVMRLIWERDFGGNAFSNYWEQISLEDATITIQQLQTMPANLLDVAAGQINLGLFEIPSTFSFVQTPEMLLAQKGKLTFATVYFVFKPSPPDPPTPLRIRYYWEGTSGKWLPLQMVSSNGHKRKRDPFF